jgi:predicted secreted hydrolase
MITNPKLWIHRGQGHYIGSLVVVNAESKEAAEKITRRQLDEAGLKSEPVEIQPLEIKENSVLIFHNGDY